MIRRILVLSILSSVRCTCSLGAQSAPAPTGAGGETIGPAPSAYYSPPASSGPANLDLLLHAPTPVYVLQPDDIITVNLYGVEDFSLKPRIAEDGTVNLPLIGPVKIGGLTVTQAEEVVDTLLIEHDMVKVPSTTIETVERPHQVVTVSGNVVKPGVIAATGRHTLSDYLSTAGELKDTASSTVTLTRSGMSPISIPLGPNPMNSSFRSIPIFAGDEIHASSMGTIYVIGAIKNQGAFPLKNTTPTTVFQAIALAGGIGFEASANSSQVVRTEGDKRIMIPVHVAKILKGKEPDFLLKNDDILYVPTDTGKAAIKGGGAGLIVSLASTYIYAHP